MTVGPKSEGQFTLARLTLAFQDNTGCQVAEGVHRCVFTLPGHTSLTEHHTETPPGVTCTIYLNTKNVFQEELKAKLGEEVIEESHNSRNTPVVLVSKYDGSVRFFMEFKFDLYPMPYWLTAQLVNGHMARFFTTLDLTEGKTAFFHSILVASICHLSVWLVWSPNNISTTHEQNLPPTQCICCCLLRLYKHLQKGLAGPFTTSKACLLGWLQGETNLEAKLQFFIKKDTGNQTKGQIESNVNVTSRESIDQWTEQCR